MKTPGSFLGKTTDNEYFRMTPKKDTRKFGDETQAVQWVAQSEAEELISKTTNHAGRTRDLQVLEAAFEALRRTAGPDILYLRGALH